MSDSINLYLGVPAGVWVQTSIFVLSALIAIYTLWNNEKQAKRRATIDLVLMETQDQRIREYKEKFATMRDSKENFTMLACHSMTENIEKNEAILALLNHYEFIATGVFEGALDEAIYKRMKRSLIIRDWHTLQPYVVELRRKESRPQLFVELEKLARKWENG